MAQHGIIAIIDVFLREGNRHMTIYPVKNGTFVIEYQRKEREIR